MCLSLIENHAYRFCPALTVFEASCEAKGMLGALHTASGKSDLRASQAGAAQEGAAQEAALW